MAAENQKTLLLTDQGAAHAKDMYKLKNALVEFLLANRKLAMQRMGQ
jgi:hypothetical protein